jgi:L-fuconolactonase
MDRIIDTHVHVWDPSVLPYEWLSGEFARAFLPGDIPRRPGDDTAMIFVEAGSTDPLGEAMWVAGLDWPERVGIVAQVDVSRGDAMADDLEELAAIEGVVGVRWNLQDHPLAAFESDALVAGLRRVARRELTFDACVRSHQLNALVRLVARVPELLVVLDHLGKPDAAQPPGADWQSSLLSLAALPNVSIKLSGVPPEADPGRPIERQAGPLLEAAVELFGPARCMLGSDWPVSTLTAHRVAPGDWFDLVFSSLGASTDERARIGWRTASEFYGIPAAVF